MLQRGRTVPLIVPPKARPLLEFLADKDVRRDSGIMSTCPYLFANQSKYRMLHYLVPIFFW